MSTSRAARALFAHKYGRNSNSVVLYQSLYLRHDPRPAQCFRARLRLNRALLPARVVEYNSQKCNNHCYRCCMCPECIAEIADIEPTDTPPPATDQPIQVCNVEHVLLHCTYGPIDIRRQELQQDLLKLQPSITLSLPLLLGYVETSSLSKEQQLCILERTAQFIITISEHFDL